VASALRFCGAFADLRDFIGRSCLQAIGNATPAGVDSASRRQLTVELIAAGGTPDLREEDRMQMGYPPIRRVVTGHDDAHVAKVLRAEPATNAKYPQPGVVSTMLWCTDRSPADIAVGKRPEDMGARIIGTAPPAGGTRFAIIDFPPGSHPHM